MDYDRHIYIYIYIYIYVMPPGFEDDPTAAQNI